MKIVLTKDELLNLKKVKRELLTDSNATFSSYARCWKKIKEIADKYNVTSQEIYNAIPNDKQ